MLPAKWAAKCANRGKLASSSTLLHRQRALVKTAASCWMNTPGWATREAIRYANLLFPVRPDWTPLVETSSPCPCSRADLDPRVNATTAKHQSCFVVHLPIENHNMTKMKAIHHQRCIKSKDLGQSIANDSAALYVLGKRRANRFMRR